MAEKKTVVYRGSDGVYRRIVIEKDLKTNEYVVYRQSLWKGKKYAKPKEIHRSKYPCVLEWDGDETLPPKIKQVLEVTEHEVRSLLRHLTGQVWEKVEDTHHVNISYHGNVVSEAIRLSGIPRYQRMRQWLSSQCGEIVILLDRNPISYYDLRDRVFKQLEVLLVRYLETKEGKKNGAE